MPSFSNSHLFTLPSFLPFPNPIPNRGSSLSCACVMAKRFCVLRLSSVLGRPFSPIHASLFLPPPTFLFSGYNNFLSDPSPLTWFNGSQSVVFFRSELFLLVILHAPTPFFFSFFSRPKFFSLRLFLQVSVSWDVDPPPCSGTQCVVVAPGRNPSFLSFSNSTTYTNSPPSKRQREYLSLVSYPPDILTRVTNAFCGESVGAPE